MCMTEFDEKAFIACMKEEGREENKKETALNFLKKGIGALLVAECTNLSLDEVQALAATL